MARRRYDKIYHYYLWLTHRLTDRQLMMVLAVVVGLAAGLGTYIFEILLHFIRAGLVNWFPVERAQFLYLIYPAVGIILATLFVKYVVKDNISEGVTRVLYAMSRSNSRIRGQLLDLGGGWRYDYRLWWLGGS
jgi:CIC family chloride channel protein